MKSIENERLLIEAFGPCLPDSTLLEDFSTLTNPIIIIMSA